MPGGNDNGNVNDNGTGGDGAPVIEGFDASPTSLPAGGGTVELSWDVAGAFQVVITPEPGPVSGSLVEVTVDSTTEFTLTAVSLQGSSEASLTVTVGDTPDDGDGDGDEPDGDEPDDDVPPPPVPSGPTSLGMIEDAVAAGEIDEIAGLRFKAFSVFGDDRLPAEFSGGGSEEEGTFVLEEIYSRFDELSPEVQDELRPFLLPPDAPGSWYQRRVQAKAKLAAPLADPPEGDFDKYDVKDGSGNSVAVVKWPKSDNSLEPTARVVQGAMADVYDKLVGLMGRAPLSDGELGEASGGDGRFDIYLLKIGGSTYGSTPPNDPGLIESVFSDSRRRPHIVQDVQNIANDHGGLGTALYERKIRANLAHEFMHAIQFAFDLSEGKLVPDYRWLADATATWAEHFVFENDHMEHADAPAFLNRLDDPLETDPDTNNRRYGAYLYFFHHVRFFGEDIVRFAWESAQVADQLTAVDRAVPEGIAKHWADFAVFNWNQDGIDHVIDSYEQRDFLAAGADPTHSDRPLLSGDQDQIELELEGPDGDKGGLEPLSAQYFRIDLTDSGIRSVLFANGLTYELKEGVPELFAGRVGDETLYAEELDEEQRDRLHVMALVKQNGTWGDEAFNLTDVAFAPFCQQAGSESIEEIVIIMANARWEEGERDPVGYVGLPSRVFLTDVACGAWEGTAKYEFDRTEPDETVVADATFGTIKFTRDTSTLEEIMSGAGQVPFGAFGTILLPSGAFQPGIFTGGVYELAAGSATWSHRSEYEIGDEECIESGSGKLEMSDALGIGTLDVRPFLTDTVGNDAPSIYRSFSITAGFVDQNEMIHGTCVDSEGNTRETESPFLADLFGGLRNNREIDKVLELSSSGDRINESWDIDEMSFSLTLQSKNIP